MRYLGGKARIGKKIAEQILARVPPEHRIEYLEPFLGGANAFEHIAPHFEKTYAGDVHEDLILMWQAVASGWVPPEHVSKEEHAAMRHASPSALRGFIRFGCSFGGNFTSGYAQDSQGTNYAATSARAVLRPAAELQRAVSLAHASYLDWPVVPGCVVYCDPPYAQTQGYSTGAFDHDVFWQRMQEWSDAGSYVFVSEESGPFEVIWEQEKRLSMGMGNEKRQRLEKLFYLPPRLFARAA